MPLSLKVAINQNRKSNQPISSAKVLDLELNQRIKSLHPPFFQCTKMFHIAIF